MSDRSTELWPRMQHVFPGGVNSPVRAFHAVGADPVIAVRASGARIEDVDGRRYVDFILSWGPLVLGHAHPVVREAIAEAASRGTSFGLASQPELELAEAIRRAMPHLEQMRFVNSGTEACMSAIRLARAFTGRSGIVKFAGGYHGHADHLLVHAGSGVATFGLPDSPGVPASTAGTTAVLPYNDRGAISEFLSEHPDDIAAVIVEPVAANMGVVPPCEGWLEHLREVTTSHGALLIFDEVLTGFRIHRSGAAARFGVIPDLTTLGKVIGGGLPVGAYGGRREIMQRVAPAGDVYQAGTLSGNPVVMSAGLATLDELARPGVWDGVAARTEQCEQILLAGASRAGVPVTINREGTILSLFFTESEVTDHRSAGDSSAERFAGFFRSMLSHGVLPPPSRFEAWFLSAAHGDSELELLEVAANHSFEAAGAIRP